MIKKYGAIPPLQTIFIDPHSVKSEFSTSKLNPKAAGRIARTSEDNNSIVDVMGAESTVMSNASLYEELCIETSFAVRPYGGEGKVCVELSFDFESRDAENAVYSDAIMKGLVERVDVRRGERRVLNERYTISCEG